MVQPNISFEQSIFVYQDNRQNSLLQNSKIWDILQFEKTHQTNPSEQNPYSMTHHENDLSTQNFIGQIDQKGQNKQQSNSSLNQSQIDDKNQSSEQSYDSHNENRQKIGLIKQNKFNKDKSLLFHLNQQTILLNITKNSDQQNDTANTSINQLKQLLQYKGYDIQKVINQYHEQKLIKIKQTNKNNINDPNMPQFEHKINQFMSQNEIKEIAKKAFSLFKLITDQKELKIIRKIHSIQIIYENYRIQWRFDNSSIRFGQCQLNKKDKTTFNGFALFIRTGKFIQSGYFKDGKPNGKGKQCNADGSTYQGDYKDGKFNGKGKYCWADGSTYQGDFKDGKPNGKGKYCYADGSTYQGDYKDGKPNGKGKQCNADGSTYQGGCKNSIADGYGKRRYADGSIYTGYWKDNKRNGEGKYVKADGQIQQRVWKDDKAIEKGYECNIF